MCQKMGAITAVKLVQFVVFNVILPCADVGTDFYTFLSFLQEGHVYWATITLGWMFLPFIINSLLACRNFFLAWRSGSDYPDMVMILFYFPFILPFRNLYNAYLLKHATGPHFLREIEEIYQEAGTLGIFESFLESGPQMVTQLVIILSTGGVSQSQLASLPVSFFSLSFTASKAFFTLRERQTRESDPTFKMVALTVLPYMMVVVLNSIILWTFIGGLLGEYVLVGIGINISVVYFCLEWRRKHSNTSTTQESKDPDENEEKEFESQNKFHFESSLTSVWVPSIVGGNSYIFWTSSVATLVVKILILSFLCLTDFMSEFLIYLRNGKVFLFWCVQDSVIENIDKYDATEICSDFSFELNNLTSCFSLDNSDLLQKIRRCNRNELELRVIMFLILTLSTVLSLVASYKLDKISNWSELTKPRMFLCISVSPVYHRSILFNFIKRNDWVGLDRFLENIPSRTARTEVVNMSDSDGRKAMLVAMERAGVQGQDMWEILAKHGGVHSHQGQSDGIVRLLAARASLCSRFTENEGIHNLIFSES